MTENYPDGMSERDLQHVGQSPISDNDQLLSDLYDQLEEVIENQEDSPEKDELIFEIEMEIELIENNF